DYGFNMVSRTRVEKHLTAGRGVFEIDVTAFLRENELLDRIPRKQPGVAREGDAALHRRPDFHAEEIARREQEAMSRGVAAIQAAAPTLTVERRAPSEDVLRELLAVEQAAFPEEVRYDEKYMRGLFLQQSAELLLLRDAGELIGFALTYASPLHPAD